MKPLLHAILSTKKFGGKPEDYIEIHNWFDQTKAHIADARHRIVLHNSFGIYLCEQAFGTIVQMNDGTFKKMPYIVNSDDKQISVRDVAENHVLTDMGYIPTLVELLDKAGLHETIVGGIRQKKLILDASTITNLQIVD